MFTMPQQVLLIEERDSVNLAASSFAQWTANRCRDFRTISEFPLLLEERDKESKPSV